MSDDFHDIVDTICEVDTRYHADAYDFMMDSLSYTQKRFKRSKHVTGDELLTGIKELLLEQFGPLTLTVLHHWGINSTDDFGNIVFNLVENNVLSKKEEDKIEQFHDGYDFGEVFDQGYRESILKKISRMR